MPQAEVILWSRLKGRQLERYKFRRQYSILHFVVDFYCPELKLAIEADGDSHYTEVGVLSDRKRQDQIEALGIHLLRFNNQDIHEHLEEVLSGIAEQIKLITSPTPP